MELNKTFTNGLWNKEINVSDFVSKNIAPYTGDASFLQGPTERKMCIRDRQTPRIRPVSFSFGKQSSSAPSFQQLEIMPLSSPVLLTYLQERGINIVLSK